MGYSHLTVHFLDALGGAVTLPRVAHVCMAVTLTRCRDSEGGGRGEGKVLEFYF